MQNPGKGLRGTQDTGRSGRVVLRVFLLSLVLTILLALFFRHFTYKLEQTLLMETQQQLQGLTDQSAILIAQKSKADQQILEDMANSISSLSKEDAVNVLFSDGFGWSEGEIDTPVQRNGNTLRYNKNIELSDGSRLSISYQVPIQSYHELLFSLYSATTATGYWVSEDGTVLYQTDQKISTLPTESDTKGSTLKFSSEHIHNVGYFMLVASSSLSDTTTMMILRSSTSMAVFVIVIFLLFLCYLLYKDHWYATNLWHLAYIDELTKLPNKNLFIKEATSKVSHQRNNYAVLVMDIGKFKLINDHFGYALGDSLLLHCAKILPRYVPQDGLCARLTGDKFVMLVSYREISALQRRIDIILEELQRFSFPKASQFQLDILIGVALLENSESSISTAIDRALFALSAQKGKQNTGYYFYENAQRDQLLEESELDKVFFTALHEEQFFIMLQPKYSLSGHRLLGAEALVRWRHPTKGLLSPAQFIPLLEKQGLLVNLDMFVVKLVCELFVRWKAERKVLLPVSVNQSRSYLFNSDYEETLLHLVDQYHVEHRLLEFEMTETLFLNDMIHFSRVLASLRKQGFLVSIDDFGSGYSSLSMLKDVHIDVIKIDQSFFSDLDVTSQGKIVVQHIIALAKELGITTIAEGVESEAQATMLTQIGCDAIQGYFFSEPLSIEAYEELLDKEKVEVFL